MGSAHWPVHVSAPGVDRADVSASHRDHEVSGLHNFVGKGFRELSDHRDADLVQNLHYKWVDLP